VGLRCSQPATEPHVPPDCRSCRKPDLEGIQDRQFCGRPDLKGKWYQTVCAPFDLEGFQRIQISANAKLIAQPSAKAATKPLQSAGSLRMPNVIPRMGNRIRCVITALRRRQRGSSRHDGRRSLCVWLHEIRGPGTGRHRRKRRRYRGVRARAGAGRRQMG
jgi:hypothetical protein